jgi:hypothetical protein
MANYRVYLLDAADVIFDAVEIDRESDRDAVLAVASLVNDNPAVEIWIGPRKVAHVTARELGEWQGRDAAEDGRAAGPPC